MVPSSYSSHGQKIQKQQDRDSRASVGGRSNKLTRRIEDRGISSRFVGRCIELTRLKFKLNEKGISSLVVGWCNKLNLFTRLKFKLNEKGISSRVIGRCKKLTRGIKERGISSRVFGRLHEEGNFIVCRGTV